MSHLPATFTHVYLPFLPPSTQACIFELDGILVDTEQDLGVAARKALSEMIGHERVAALDDVLFQVPADGPGREGWESDFYEAIMFAAELPTDEAAKLMFVDRVRDKLLLVSRTARPCKGARSLISHLER